MTINVDHIATVTPLDDPQLAGNCAYPDCPKDSTVILSWPGETHGKAIGACDQHGGFPAFIKVIHDDLVADG
jgi:hypothetical protein